MAKGKLFVALSRSMVHAFSGSLLGRDLPALKRPMGAKGKTFVQVAHVLHVVAMRLQKKKKGGFVKKLSLGSALWNLILLVFKNAGRQLKRKQRPKK